MSDLLPCPFCGFPGAVAGYRSCDCCGKPYNGQVVCQNGDCSASVDHFDTDEEAIAAWNRRAPLPTEGE